MTMTNDETYHARIKRASAGYKKRPHEDAERHTYTQDTSRGPEEWPYWMVEIDGLADALDRFGPRIIVDRSVSYPTRDDVDHRIDFEITIYDSYIE